MTFTAPTCKRCEQRHFNFQSCAEGARIAAKPPVRVTYTHLKDRMRGDDRGPYGRAPYRNSAYGPPLNPPDAA